MTGLIRSASAWPETGYRRAVRSEMRPTPWPPRRGSHRRGTWLAVAGCSSVAVRVARQVAGHSLVQQRPGLDDGSGRAQARLGNVECGPPAKEPVGAGIEDELVVLRGALNDACDRDARPTRCISDVRNHGGTWNGCRDPEKSGGQPGRSQHGPEQVADVRPRLVVGALPAVLVAIDPGPKFGRLSRKRGQELVG